MLSCVIIMPTHYLWSLFGYIVFERIYSSLMRGVVFQKKLELISHLCMRNYVWFLVITHRWDFLLKNCFNEQIKKVMEQKNTEIEFLCSFGLYSFISIKFPSFTSAIIDSDGSYVTSTQGLYHKLRIECPILNKSKLVHTCSG